MVGQIPAVITPENLQNILGIKSPRVSQKSQSPAVIFIQAAKNMFIWLTMCSNTSEARKMTTK